MFKFISQSLQAEDKTQRQLFDIQQQSSVQYSI